MIRRTMLATAAAVAMFAGIAGSTSVARTGAWSFSGFFGANYECGGHQEDGWREDDADQDGQNHSGITPP